MNDLRIGIVGCDTSHCSRFAEILNGGGPQSFGSARIAAAFPGGSEAVDPGFCRREKFTAELSARGVPLVGTMEEAADSTDALMILSADGASHLKEFLRCARPGKPVFVDKPLALSSREASGILDHARKIGTSVFSASALRFSRPFCSALAEFPPGDLIGADLSGPATWITREQGLFFYGIHAVEMLFAALGPGCGKVTSFSNDLHDVCLGEWRDGRLGAVRGNRAGNKTFSASLHGKGGTRIVENAIPAEEPIYIPLLEKVIPFLRSGVPPVSGQEMREVIGFIEAARESARTGRAAALEPAP